MAEEESEKIIKMYEEMFANRYTEEDPDYKKTVSMPIPHPPCVPGYFIRQNFGGNRGGRGSGHWGNRGGGRDWNRNRDHHGGGRYDQRGYEHRGQRGRDYDRHSHRGGNGGHDRHSNRGDRYQPY